MENHPAILLLKYVYLIIQCTKTTFYNNILMNYRDIKPKRDKCIISLKFCDVRSSSGNTFIPCIVLTNDGNFQETFPVLRQELRIYSLSLL